MWNPALGGLPQSAFSLRLTAADGRSREADGKYATSDQIAGYLSPIWAEKLGLRTGIPILSERSMLIGTLSGPVRKKAMW